MVEPNDDPEDMIHTGVGETDGGLTFTYRHLDGEPQPGAELYRVRTYVPYTDRPVHENTFFVPGPVLHRFLDGQIGPGQQISDIRPITQEQAQKEIALFEQYDGEAPTEDLDGLYS